MDRIRESTELIYIHFWNKYDEVICEDNITDKYQKIFGIVLNTADNSHIQDNYKKELANLFSLYFYIIDNVDTVYKNRCEYSNEILSILSIYSLVCKELDYLLRLQLNLDIELVMQINQDMLNSMCIINNLKDNEISKLLGDGEGDGDDIHSSHINSAKERLFKLYLKLISII